ncbi:DUF4118 domain-containing protein [Celerinatantimonas yamalensis]|uniref:histidine kinase n=1 Tax=Celerinatantimonas yamalensis TaxID=559956 RepID=A0ABW9G3P8_9GAMM
MRDNDRADALLQELCQQETGKGRGHLKIFLGAAPGVGKTYTMLQEAQQLSEQGIDLIIGVIETHGRTQTQEASRHLPIHPCQHINYRGKHYSELDLDGLLAKKPALVLVDEFAHSNIPGSRHQKRYQDIQELLDVGIDVYTTLNIQHLDSLNDLIYQLTQVRVKEVIPDKVVLEADTLLFVDLPPRQLIERLKQGQVYLPEQAQAALQAFFSVSNLTALRELALQMVASHVQGEMNLHLNTQGKPNIILQDKLMLCLSEQLDGRALIRSAQRIALRQQVPWIVLHVAQTNSLPLAIEQHLSFASKLGAEIITMIDMHIAEAILHVAKQQSVSQLLIGKPRKKFFARSPVLQHLLSNLGSLDLTILAEQSSPKSNGSFFTRLKQFSIGRQILVGLVSVSLATGVGLLVTPWLPETAMPLIFIVAVLLSAVISSAGPASITALFSFMACNFFFTPPYFTFKVGDHSDLLNLISLLLVGLLVGRLAAHQSQQLKALRSSQQLTQMLLSLTQALSAANNIKDVARHTERVISGVLQCICVVFNSEQQGVIDKSLQLNVTDQAALQWCLTHQQVAGRHSSTLNGSDMQYHPLGPDLALGLKLAAPLPLAVDYQLQSMLTDVRATIDRMVLTEQLQKSRFESETNRIRAALLSSVSHDLKTPLASIIGSSTTLLDYQQQLCVSDQHDLVQSVLQEAQRLSSYIQNLLDMIRLGQSDFQLKREHFSIKQWCQDVIARSDNLDHINQFELRFDQKVTHLYAHRALMEQVLTNLLDNARRYSPRDQPIVIQTMYAPPELIIDVIDQGTGISESDRSKIFELFYTQPVGDSGSRGTGLGLAISRAMVEAHGGRIWSFPGDYGKGTYMRIALPLNLNTKET